MEKFTHRHCDYLGEIFSGIGSFEKLIRNVTRRLKKDIEKGKVKDFSHIVVSGVSGCVVGAAVALKLKKHLIVVRKASDGSHSWNRIEGYPVEYFDYIFLDDFICDGNTASYVYNEMKNTVGDNGRLVGIYQYHKDYQKWYDGFEYLVGIKSSKN